MHTSNVPGWPFFSELMNSLKRTKINVLPLFFFFWNAFSLLLSFSPWFRLSEARSFRSFANRQPVLSSSQFSDVPCCEAALGQQETFVMCFADLENATVCMGFEDSRKLSRDCHICIDFLMDLVGFQQREEETFHEEKRSWIRSTYKLLQIFRFSVGFGFFGMKVYSQSSPCAYKSRLIPIIVEETLQSHSL